MDKLQKMFEKCFKLPFSILPLLGTELSPIGAEKEGLLFGSKSAVDNPILIQGDIPRIMDECPPNYFLVGFWGHGVNSYAFYYSRCDEHSKIFFRLGYGGVYTDNEEAAKNIARFLPLFFEFEETIKSTGGSLVAIDSMGEGKYIVETQDKKHYEYSDSLLASADFGKIMST